MSSAVLAIELSTPTGQVAVVSDGEVLFESRFTSNRSHNSKLYAPLAGALEAAGDRLGLIVVGTGPGSYTGVRISIAAAHGVAISRNVPVVGLPSIAALSDAPGYHVVGDARRGKYYTVLVSAGTLQGPLELHDAEALTLWRQAHASLPVLTSDTDAPADLADVQSVPPSAARIALQASRLDQPQIQAMASASLEPFYIAEAFITEKKKR